MAFLDFNQVFPTLLGSIGSIFDMQRGINTQIAASKYAGLGYRQQAASTKEIAEYNIELDRQDLNRQLDSFSRDISNIMATQRAQMADTGASITSKSFRALQNKVLDQSIRHIIQARNASKIQEDQRRFQARQAEVEFENQARLSEYQAKVNIYKSQQGMFSNIPSLINQFGSLF